MFIVFVLLGLLLRYALFYKLTIDSYSITGFRLPLPLIRLKKFSAFDIIYPLLSILSAANLF